MLTFYSLNNNFMRFGTIEMHTCVTCKFQGEKQQLSKGRYS